MDDMKSWGNGFLLMLLAFVAIIALAGNLNAVVANGLDSLYAWVAGINFIAEIFLIISLRKSWKKKGEDKE